MFTMYAEKICLPSISYTPCDKAWAYEMVRYFARVLILAFGCFQVPDAELKGFEEKQVTVRDVAECRTKCRDQENFACRWDTFINTPGID